jgi:hypothetical protein
MKVIIKTSIVSIEMEQAAPQVDLTTSYGWKHIVELVKGLAEETNKLHHEVDKALEKALE